MDMFKCGKCGKKLSDRIGEKHYCIFDRVGKIKRNKTGISCGDLDQDMEDFRVVLFEVAEILENHNQKNLANSLLLRAGFLIGTIYKLKED